MKSQRCRLRFTQSMLVSIVAVISGCSDSKPSSAPTRTFSAPAARVKDAELYSAPFGCNGNPYYYNYKIEKWVYFDDRGREHESPLQSPCPGMRAKKVKTGPSNQPITKHLSK